MREQGGRVSDGRDPEEVELNMSRESFAEFTVREQGPEAFPLHTVELRTSYEPAFDGSKGQRGELARTLPQGATAFDRDAKCWLILAVCREQAVEIAKKHFRSVSLREGERRTDLKGGRVTVQEGLFT